MEGQKGGVSGITEKTKKAWNVMQVANRPTHNTQKTNPACTHMQLIHR